MFEIFIFDWKRTLYDPDNKVLMKGAIELLEFIKSKNIPMVLIGKGGGEMDQEVDKLGVKNYFRQIIFAEGAKEIDTFRPYISPDPKKTLFIGDRVRSELEIGKRLGATTIWVKQGKFAVEEPLGESQKPEHIVSNLIKCKELLKNFYRKESSEIAKNI